MFLLWEFQGIKLRNISFRLERIFNTTPAASKNTAWFKSGQNWLKNKQLASLI